MSEELEQVENQLENKRFQLLMTLNKMEYLQTVKGDLERRIEALIERKWKLESKKNS